MSRKRKKRMKKCRSIIELQEEFKLCVNCKQNKPVAVIRGVPLCRDCLKLNFQEDKKMEQNKKYKEKKKLYTLKLTDKEIRTLIRAGDTLSWLKYYRKAKEEYHLTREFLDTIGKIVEKVMTVQMEQD